MMFETLLITNIFATAFMTGLIWFVQIVHYPGFHQLDSTNFTALHRFHIPRTGFVVIPPMIAELGSSIWLITAYNQLWIYNAVGLAIVIAIWISTFALQTQFHRKLKKSPNKQLITGLVTTNWIRTLLWTAKMGLGIYILTILITSP
ncbi:MAG: hypothetical protein U5J63_15490 [Fodinibius sp.]|nr:hypothetical protein [Fodinibius sp.]